MVLQHVRAGRRVVELAAELGVCAATVHRWIAQDKTHRGNGDGTTTGEKAELSAARTSIREREDELAATRLASQSFDEGRVVRPKELYPIVAKLGESGHGRKASCRLPNVAPSGFFAWKFAPPTGRSIRRAFLTDLIVEIWHESRQTYGKRRMRPELLGRSRPGCQPQACRLDHARIGHLRTHETQEIETQRLEPLYNRGPRESPVRT